MAGKQRYFIRLGDKTTHGGTVISAWGKDCPESKWTIYEIPVACIGDYVTCPKCRGTHQIIQGDNVPHRPTFCGRVLASTADRTTCGAGLLASQNFDSYTDESWVPPVVGMVAARKEAEAARGIQTADAMPGISPEVARMLAEQTEEEKKTCQCGGPHPLKIVGEEVKPIGGYTGALRAPGLLFKMDESPRRIDARTIENSRRIRRWAREAAAYHEIPYVMLAVLLEQENGQNVSAWRRFAQGYERFLQSSSAVIKDATDAPVPGAEGSTGIINMIRATYLETAAYTKKTYFRPLLPTHKQDIDSGFVGVDVEADMYYAAAHIRYLIDDKGNNPCTKGEITLDQVQMVFTRYNYSGDRIPDSATNYGKAAMNKLKGAYNGSFTLHFYE